MPRIEDLRLLLFAAASGSVTEAARQVGCSQPTASRRLRRLEDELDARLLDRSTSRADLTPAGEQVASFARRWVEEWDRLSDGLRDQDRALSGRLTIITSTAPAALLPDVVASFSSEHPQVRFDIAVADSAAVAEAVAEGRADLGLAGHRSTDRTLEQVAVATDELVVVVPSGHHLAAHDRVDLDQLAGERFVLREDGSGTRRVFEEALEHAGVDPGTFEATAVLGDAASLVAAVRAGLGVGVASRINVRPDTDGVVALPLSSALTRPLWLVLAAGRRPSPHRDAFAEHVRATLGGASAAGGTR